MAKMQRQFSCQNCGATHPRWTGRCESCGEWNSIIEETPANSGVAGGPAPKRRAGKGRHVALSALNGEISDTPRLVTGIGELDRVCGGGLVPGSALLVGGDPGIGKSTILLQAVCTLANRGARTIYISGEEATEQIRMRAKRLGLAQAPVALGAETHVRDVVSTLEHEEHCQAIVIDSIQTMWSDTLDSAPGTVSQVRACTQELIRVTKKTGAVLFIIGHVTKEGQIAGPRVLEHMVDTVLYFEGERGHHFRILRAVKNRFGPTNEIGVFEMGERGLSEVPNPSALFLGERDHHTSGTAVFAGIEGTRPLLVEFQSLVAQSTLGTPRRAVVGWDTGRLAMVLAVLDAQCGLSLGGRDVYLNVAGGLRIVEPAADLAVAASLISSLTGVPLPADTILFGEISLSGVIRPTGQTETRLKEAAKLGFKKAILPKSSTSTPLPPQELELQETGSLAELVERLSLQEKT